MEKLFAVAVIAALMTGCITQTSAQQHARHYVYYFMETDNINRAVDKMSSVKALQPAFEYIYDAGKSARSAGLTAIEAEAEAKRITLQMNGETNFSHYNGQSFSQSWSDRERKGLNADIQATFLDGYDGK